MPSKRLRGRAARTRAAARGALVEAVAIPREMVRIAAALYMRVAEAVGSVVLATWNLSWPVAVATWRWARRLVRAAERVVTPARATLAVAGLAAVLLAASQFADYRSVAIGGAGYAGVEAVAPPPEVDAVRAGSAHAWLGLPLALAALVVLARCATGRSRSAWALAPIGLAMIAISLLVDAPKGLDEGEAALAYEGVEALLLGGFWAQLAAGAVLVALAPLIGGLLPSRDRAARRRPRRVAPARGVAARGAGG